MDNGLRGAAWVFFDPSALPIQLSSLKASAASRGCVQLEWTTLSEINNYGFYVQRRTPGESAFSTLPGSFESGHGTTSHPQEYSYSDTSVGAGEWFYRLRQIDLDGAVHYSDALQVDIAADADRRLPGVIRSIRTFPIRSILQQESTIRSRRRVTSSSGLLTYWGEKSRFSSMVWRTRGISRCSSMRAGWRAGCISAGCTPHLSEIGGPVTLPRPGKWS